MNTPTTFLTKLVAIANELPAAIIHVNEDKRKKNTTIKVGVVMDGRFIDHYTVRFTSTDCVVDATDYHFSKVAKFVNAVNVKTRQLKIANMID